MIFRQMFDSVSGPYSYLLARRRGGEALIIDPVLEKVERYIQLLNELDLRLVKAIDTHLHADHVTGLGELRDRTQCVTVMGKETKADVVSIRVADGDTVEADGVRLGAIYTPGHTDDSYCFTFEDRVFTGDTLLIRGTGRTDFQNGDARAQYDSLFNRLLKLTDATLVYPAHDYKGDTVSTIGEEKAFNPRLQVGSVDDYVAIMLPDLKMMDVAVPANMSVGLSQDEIARSGWSLEPAELASALRGGGIVLVDLREQIERDRYGEIPGSLHIAYGALANNLRAGSSLRSATRGKDLVFYCAYGARSAMAVRSAHDAGISTARHLHGGFDRWTKDRASVAP